MNTTNQIAEIKRTSASTLTNTINPWIITQDAYSKLRRRYWSVLMFFFVVYVCVSPSEVWDGSCLSWRTILIYNPLSQSRPAAQGYLGFFGNESADLLYHQLWWSICSAWTSLQSLACVWRQPKLILIIHSLLS